MGCIVHGVAKSQTRLSDFHFTWNKKLGSPKGIQFSNLQVSRNSTGLVCKGKTHFIHFPSPNDIHTPVLPQGKG